MSFYIMYNTKDRGFFSSYTVGSVSLTGPYETEEEAQATAEASNIRKFTLLKEEGVYEMEPRVTYKKKTGAKQ